jgi:hypothetical protein
LGELNDLEFIGPSPQGFKIGYEFQRVYAIQPAIHTSTDEDLERAGEQNRDVEYIPREQPKGMKLQSLPAGFNTSIEN